MVLDEPGVYVLPGLVTNPPLPSDQLPDVDLLAVDGTAAVLVPDGRPMVVNLWYASCPPCTRELADFAVVDAELGDRVRFVGVNPWDTADTMVSFAADRGVTYELLRDDRGAFAEALDIVSYPATLFVDADGAIVRRDRADRRRRPAPAHHGAVAVNVGLSFLRGMVATVNPCGFVLLPTYLMYFLGIEATRSDSERATVRRALLVGAAVTAGFMVVFVLVGGVTKWSTDWVLANAKYVTGIAGLAFVVLGIAMLFGFKLRITTPALAVGERDTTVRSMFVYGIVYATVSLSCTLALFAPLLFERGSVGAGVVNGAAFALGMGLLVTALTVALAVANHALLRVLRTAMQHIQALAGAFVLLVGPLPPVLLLGRRRAGRVGPAERGRRELPEPHHERPQRQLAVGRRRARRHRARGRAVRRRPTAPRRRGFGRFARA